jgi:hypothetical protein
MATKQKPSQNKTGKSKKNPKEARTDEARSVDDTRLSDVHSNPVDAMISEVVSLFITHPRRLDVMNYVNRFSKEPGSRSYEFAKTFLALTNDEMKADLIITTMPPTGAMYNTDVSCPTVFRQHNMVYIDMITVDLRTLVSDPMFWWQPANDPQIMQATQNLAQFVNSFNANTNLFNVGLLRTNVVQ